MGLLTELHGDLLTESGLPLWAEDEADGSGVIRLSGRATLSLTAQATLTWETVFTPRPLHSQATLVLKAQARLNKSKTLQAQATLKLQARQLAANVIPGPSGLSGLMKIITDPHNSESVLDQYLLIWFDGHPAQCPVSLQIDHAPAFQPAWTWENPGTTQGAILKINGAEIPGDGLTHQITVRVWQAVSGKTSLASELQLFAKTPKPKFIEQPQWGRATVIRQGDGLRLSDVTRIDWRHPGAVKIMAQYEVRNSTGRLYSTQSTVGYADHDEDSFIAENLGELVFIGGTSLRPVTFGVCSIGQGTFGPPFWTDPVQIKQRPNADYYTPVEPPHPDIATRQDLVTTITPTLPYWTPTPFFAFIRSTVAQHVGRAFSALENSIVDQAIYRAYLKIKDILRQGGRVTLDDFGTFEARWNPDRTIRSVAFVPSLGFKEGVKQGRILTDAEAKA